MKIKLELKWNDLWIGVYWIKKNIDRYWTNELIRDEFHIWACIIPCMPIHIWWELEDEDKIDIEAATKALERNQFTSWEETKKELGL